MVPHIIFGTNELGDATARDNQFVHAACLKRLSPKKGRLQDLEARAIHRYK